MKQCSRNWSSRIWFPASLTLIAGLACMIVWTPTHPRSRVSPVELLAKLPLRFEPNHGQADANVRFLSRGTGPQLFLTRNEAVVGGVRMRPVGGNPDPRIEGLEELPGKSHYFIGNVATQWRTNVPAYARVRYRDVYPGVDLVYYGSQSQLEYDFVVGPGGDPAIIRVEFDGVEQMELEEGGGLVLRTANGELRQRAPVFYQQVGGTRREIAGRCVRQGERQIGFEVEDHDPSIPLVIDPLLTYSSFLGGRAGDVIHGIAVDASGNIYLTGSTESGNFPTASPFQSTNRGAPDAFVSKINAAGNALIYSTYLGGSGIFGDEGSAIALDTTGNAYVTGFTSSRDFPISADAVQRMLRGGFNDAFIAKLNATGSALIYSTYLGGDGADEPAGIAVDPVGNAFVTGTTRSRNFPTTPGALQRALAGGFPGERNGFVSKLNAAGSALVYSTYLGGADDDSAAGIAVDTTGSAYVTGTTSSANFSTARPFQAAKGGGTDAFVTKLNPDGATLAYSTYLGGGSNDQGRGIAVDSAGSAYVTGETGSSEFPTANAAQPLFGGFSDAFVTKLSPEGNRLVYSTFLGGRTSDGGFGIGVDSKGNAFVTGSAQSEDFPVANAIQAEFGGRFRDAFVARLNASGSLVLYGTYLGGPADDEGRAIVVDRSGDVYVAGRTLSTNFPTTPGALQTTYGGGNVFVGDAFVAKLTTDTVVTLSAASFSPRALAAESIASAFGEGLAVRTEAATTTPLPTVLAGTSVRVTDSAGVTRLAPLFFVSPGQINYLIPAGTATGLATVNVTVEQRVVATGTVRIERVAPGLFSANADGRGVAAALGIRARAGNQSLVPVFQCGTAPGSCVAIPIDPGPPTDQVVLILFGTGIRGRTALSAVRVEIGGQRAEVLYADSQGDFVGLDQVNVLIPRSLAGRGEVPVVLTVDGRTANTVTVNVGRFVPPPCPVPLTPGAPFRFTLPAVPFPSLFTDDFCVAAPAGASRLEVRLVTETSGADIDLYVRFGSRVDLSNGRAVADYASEGPTGNETIVVTRSSSPPLTAGTYFIGLGLATTGRPVAGTLAAIVE